MFNVCRVYQVRSGVYLYNLNLNLYMGYFMPSLKFKLLRYNLFFC